MAIEEKTTVDYRYSTDVIDKSKRTTPELVRHFPDAMYKDATAVMLYTDASKSKVCYDLALTKNVAAADLLALFKDTTVILNTVASGAVTKLEKLTALTAAGALVS